MKKYMLLGLLSMILISCTSSVTKETMNYNKERVDNVEKYLWENQLESN